jgi:5-(carboxyamino)imidazole ribonucleotide mutase
VQGGVLTWVSGNAARHEQREFRSAAMWSRVRLLESGFQVQPGIQRAASGMTQEKQIVVGVVMGSRSDWETMSAAAEVLDQFGVSYECRVVSAHRTPAWMAEYATTAESRGLKIIIAGAGGAAHLPGMIASQTVLPVLGVPVQSKALNGLDSLLSIVQMPGGIPVATLAIGSAGAKNAGLLAVRILATSDASLTERLHQFHRKQTESVLQDSFLPNLPQP